MVDKAEDEPELAHQINAVAPDVMASVARKNCLRFIHISTDYVFDGKKGFPYIETDDVNPLNEYGKSKLLGEKNIQNNYSRAIILRTSWIFSCYGKNFLSTIVKNLQKQETITVVRDQIGSPTAANVLANGCVNLLKADNNSQLLHFAGAQYLSWFEFAQTIEDVFTIKKKNH